MEDDVCCVSVLSRSVSDRLWTCIFPAKTSRGFPFSQQDDGDDGSSNAFTFSLLGQLKDSLVTYDNSLKGFLDVGKAAANTVGLAENEDKTADNESSTAVTSAVAAPSAARDKLAATIEMEKQLEEQRSKYQEELAEAKAKADEHMKAVLEEEDKKRATKIKGSFQLKAADDCMYGYL